MVPESNASSTAGLVHDLQQVKQLAHQTVEALKRQREMLRQRGMSLPPTVLNSIVAVRAEIRQLEQRIIEDQNELGQLRALADMSAQLTTSLSVDHVLREVMDIVIALTGAERGYIILLDSDTNELVYRVSRHDDNSMLHDNQRETIEPQISTTIVKRVLNSHEPLLTDNAFQDERLQSNQSIANYSLRSVLCVPLLYKETILGVVYVDNRFQSGIFSEREKNTLMAFAHTAAVAIRNAGLFAEIQQMLGEITSVKDLMDDVFASVGSGIIATDASNQVTTFNRAAAEILHMSADDVIGKRLDRVLPKITTDFEDYLTNVRINDDVQTFEGELDRGTDRIALSMKLTPLKDSEDQARGVAVMIDDVTQQVERDQMLRVVKTYLPPQMVDNIHAISGLALGGERRTVTCMFVEVRPLSTLKDVRPNEVMSILNDFLSIATECVHEMNGIIDKYMGNEVMALFNTQLNPQDETHGMMAVNAALLMRDRFLEFYRQLGIDPDPHYYRIGMHTGVATMGNVGSLNRRDFTAIGDTINLAKRLEENAEHGQIIISDETYTSLTRCTALDSYHLVEHPPIQVKGRQQQTRIYEVFRRYDE